MRIFGGRRWRAWVIRALLLLLVFPAVELSFRGLLWAKGEPYSAAATKAAFARVLSEMGEPVPTPKNANPSPGQSSDPAGGDTDDDTDKPDRFLHPYLGWETWRGLQAIERQRTRPERESVYEIWVLGGSVAATFGTPHRGGVNQLIADLHADPRFAGREIRVINHGRGAYKEPQQVNLVTYLLSLVPPPDAVINLDGFNEVAIGNQNVPLGFHPIYPSPGQWGTLARSVTGDPKLLDGLFEIRRHEDRAKSLIAWATRAGAHHSAVLGWIALRRLKQLKGDWGRAQGAYVGMLGNQGTAMLDGPEIDASLPPEEIIAQAVRVWSESSRSLHAICAERGIHYLHVLQPTLHDPGAKPLTADEIRTGTAVQAWIDGVRIGYPLLREEGKRLAELGVAFYDASGVFKNTTTTIYHDACHFENEGNEILARAISQAFLKSVGEL